MNRRKFLQRSSFGAAAVAGLPLAKKLAAANPHLYSKTVQEKKTETDYGLVLTHAGIQDFRSATVTERTMTLGIKEFSTSGESRSNGKFNYLNVNSTSTDASDTWKVNTISQGRIEGEHKLPKKYTGNLQFLIKPFEFAEIQTAKGKTLLRLTYSNEVKSSDSDCFLTTACVQHKQLPDDCDELQTLRHLRDNYMQHTEEGQWLIHQYRDIAPGIVQSIGQYENSHEIYEYMYQYMITPAVQLVKEGELQEAAEHYILFVKALREKYC